MGGLRTQVCAVGFDPAAPALRNSRLVTCVRLIVDSEDTWEEEESLDMSLVASFDHAHRQMPSPQAPARKQSGLVTRGGSRSAKGVPEVWRTPPTPPLVRPTFATPVLCRHLLATRRLRAL